MRIDCLIKKGRNIIELTNSAWRTTEVTAVDLKRTYIFVFKVFASVGST